MLYEELESPPFFVSNRRGVVFSHFLFPLPSLKRTLTLTLDWCNPAIETQTALIPPKGTRNTNPRSATRSQDFAVPSFPSRNRVITSSSPWTRTKEPVATMVIRPSLSGPPILSCIQESITLSVVAMGHEMSVFKLISCGPACTTMLSRVCDWFISFSPYISKNKG